MTERVVNIYMSEIAGIVIVPHTAFAGQLNQTGDLSSWVVAKGLPTTDSPTIIAEASAARDISSVIALAKPENSREQTKAGERIRNRQMTGPKRVERE